MGHVVQFGISRRLAIQCTWNYEVLVKGT